MLDWVAIITMFTNRSQRAPSTPPNASLHHQVDQTSPQTLQQVVVVVDATPAPVDHDGILLPQAVRARLRLKVVVGIPVAVKNDDRVGSGQVDAQSPSPGRQQKAAVL